MERNEKKVIKIIGFIRRYCCSTPKIYFNWLHIIAIFLLLNSTFPAPIYNLYLRNIFFISCTAILAYNYFNISAYIVITKLNDTYIRFCWLDMIRI